VSGMSSRAPRHGRAALVLVAAAAVLVGPLAGGQATAASTPSPAARRAAVLSEIHALRGSGALVDESGVDGTVTFLGAGPGQALRGPDDGAPEDIARSFVDRYAPAFGVDDPAGDLVVDRTERSLDGGTTVRFRQEHDGMRVLAGEIAVQIAADGSVRSSSGEASPATDLGTVLGTDPSVAASDAVATAITLTERDSGVAAASLLAGAAELMVYDPALIGAPGPRAPRLVWRVVVRTGLGDVNEFVLVDAVTGAVALHFDQREDAKNRAVCDNANVVQSSFAAAVCLSPVRTEGGPAVAVTDVNDAYDLSGATYDFYLSRFGRDSIDGAGLPIRSRRWWALPRAAPPAA